MRVFQEEDSVDAVAGVGRCEDRVVLEYLAIHSPVAVAAVVDGVSR